MPIQPASGTRHAATDYSKWDKMAMMLDDDGDAETEALATRHAGGMSTSSSGPVRITRLDQSSSVTIGNGGIQIGGPSTAEVASGLAYGINVSSRSQSAGAAGVQRAFDHSKWDALHVSDDSDEDQDEDGEGMHADTAPVRGALPDQTHSERACAAASASAAADAAGKHRAGASQAGGGDVDATTRNGGSTDAYCWSQDRKEVTVRVFVAAGTRAKQVEVKLSPDRLCLRVGAALVLDKPFAYPVYLPRGSDDTDVDWEVMDHASGRRVVRVSVVKGIPGGENLPALPRSDG